jgi:hypothetical protein
VAIIPAMAHESGILFCVYKNCIIKVNARQDLSTSHRSIRCYAELGNPHAKMNQNVNCKRSVPGARQIAGTTPSRICGKIGLKETSRPVELTTSANVSGTAFLYRATNITMTIHLTVQTLCLQFLSLSTDFRKKSTLTMK